MSETQIATPFVDARFKDSLDDIVFVTISDEDVDRINTKYKRFSDLQRESPSSFKQFDACPGQWLSSRYLLPREASGFPAVLGSYIHRILECFYNAPPAMRTKELLAEYIQRARSEVTGEYRSSDSLGDSPFMLDINLLEDIHRIRDTEGGWAMPTLFKRTNEFIKNLDEFDPDYTKVNVLSTEMMGKLEYNGVEVNGKIDRITIDDHGNEIVEDWKTGKDPDETEDEWDVTASTFIPVGLYILMREEDAKQHGRKIVSAELLYLKSALCADIPVDDDVKKASRFLLTSTVNAMNEIKQTKQLPLIPSTSNCKWCPIKTVCPARKNNGKTFDEAVQETKQKMLANDQ